jgi:hypothetical protein
VKHFSVDWLIRRNKLREVGDGMPAPFPGRYPTRFAYRVWVPGRKGTVDYCGKPSVEAFKRFWSFTLKSPKYVFYEFDRKGIITRWGSKKSNSAHVTLHRVYHPFSGADPLYTFRQKWTRKKISGFVAYYSPVEKLKKEQVDGHKQWLRALGYIPQLPLGKPKGKVSVSWTVACDNCGHLTDYKTKPMPVTMCKNCGSIDVLILEKHGL